MNKYFKFLIAALMVAAGIFLMFNRNIGWGIVVVILAGIPIFLFFKNEFILLAFYQLRKQKMDKAADWLTSITDYEKQLHKSQFGYFHYLQGLTLAEKQPQKVEPLMKKALDFGLNMKHDRAMATLNLAAGALQKGRRQEGARLLDEAKKLDSAGMMTEQIKMLKDQMKLPTMQKHMHNPNMRNRGKF
ncbi:hypothetical protein SAMN05421847_2451 [Halpernia humi]|uniref:DUF2892 domain-containing protein n=1 Tax=Halpernia humi TaxID=493375 RepID=A0A1H6AI91_9FLAO|nr:hypothetical protein [Halpernia humi]SEG48408.1 hypothetical protein SAMN05421847_2451 [Halpernia humi]